MTINTNVAALQGQIAYKQDQAQAATSVQRLSTGLRINSAKDDPSGLIAATGLSSQLAQVAAQQSGDDRVYIKAAFADDVLGVVSNVLLDAQSIVLQNANTSGLTQRQLDANQVTLNAIINGVAQIGAGTSFLGDRLFGPNVQLSSDAAGASTGTADLDPTKIGVIYDRNTGQTYTLADLRDGGALAENANPKIADEVIAAAVKQIATAQASLGNFQNSVAATGNVRSITQENLSDALSQIQDTDYATETATYVRSETLSQAALGSMAIANSNANSLLALLGN